VENGAMPRDPYSGSCSRCYESGVFRKPTLLRISVATSYLNYPFYVEGVASGFYMVLLPVGSR
jgi:hypothetical protein